MKWSIVERYAEIEEQTQRLAVKRNDLKDAFINLKIFELKKDALKLGQNYL